MSIFLNFFKSLSFGGALGIGIAGIVFLIYPDFFQKYITLRDFMILGGIFGASFHRLLDNIIVNGILSPVGKVASYYGKIIQLELQARQGYISRENYENIKAKLDEQYFLGDYKESYKIPSLPPKSEDGLNPERILNKISSLEKE